MAEEDFGIAELFICREYTTRRFDFVRPRNIHDHSSSENVDGNTSITNNSDLKSETNTASQDILLTQNIDALEAAATDFDLTGQIIWLVSVVTAHYLAVTRLGERMDVIELGAGAGLLGLVASQVARSVCLTDFEEEVITLLQRNTRHAHANCAISVNQLSWGDINDISHLPHKSYPCIVAADVVYWQHSIEPLFRTVAALLPRQDNAVFVLGYVERVSRMTTLLLESAAAVGLTHRIVGWDWLGVEPPALYRDHLHRMTLFEFSWPSASATAKDVVS